MRLDDVVRLDAIPVLGTGKTDYKILRTKESSNGPKPRQETREWRGIRRSNGGVASFPDCSTATFAESLKTRSENRVVLRECWKTYGFLRRSDGRTRKTTAP